MRLIFASLLLSTWMVVPYTAHADSPDSVAGLWTDSIQILRDYGQEMHLRAQAAREALNAPADRADCPAGTTEGDCAQALAQSAIQSNNLAPDAQKDAVSQAASALPQLPHQIDADAAHAEQAADQLAALPPPTTRDEAARILTETLGLVKETPQHLLPNLFPTLEIGAMATAGVAGVSTPLGNYTAAHPWSPYLVTPVEILGYGVPIAGTFAMAVFGHNADASSFTARALAFNLYAEPFAEAGKLLIHCSRPDGSDNQGCPSAHAMEFTGLAVLGAKGRPTWVKILIYLGAAGATATRVGGAKHYLYQVTMGATIGAITASAVNDAWDSLGYDESPTHHKGVAKALGTDIPIGKNLAVSYRPTTAQNAGGPWDGLGGGAIFTIHRRP